MVILKTNVHEWGECPRYGAHGVFSPVLSDEDGDNGVALVKEGTFSCDSLHSKRLNSSTTSTGECV